ncbi:MAG: DUF4249 domain-containing protein [Alphaproteobacteria bacterium]|nr:DUF4249 domain-containing protein [Alphaproteobacteria bacterium]
MKQKLKIFLLIFIVISCKKIINLNLNSQPSQYVIEALLSDSGNGVFISQSLNFYDTSNFPMVSNALVSFTTSNGTQINLPLIKPGFYADSNFKGKSGETYTLNITINDYNFVASSTIPNKISIDTLLITKLQFGFDSQYFVRPIYRDIAGERNFYFFALTNNNKPNNGFTIWDDNFNDGGVSSRPINVSDTLEVNDRIKVELRCIERNVYNYLQGLRNTKNNQIRPANPISNITANKGLVFGYFSAYTSSTKSAIIQ